MFVVLFLFLWFLSGFSCWVVYKLSEYRQLSLNDLDENAFFLTMWGGVSILIFLITGLGVLWDKFTNKYGNKVLIKLPEKK